jgi:hypothetical protein
VALATYDPSAILLAFAKLLFSRRRIYQSLPKMTKVAQSPGLTPGFRKHEVEEEVEARCWSQTKCKPATTFCVSALRCRAAAITIKNHHWQHDSVTGASPVLQRLCHYDKSLTVPSLEPKSCRIIVSLNDGGTP